MLDLDIMNSLNKLVVKELESNNFVFSESTVNNITNILFANDNKSNRIFYDFFQNVELYDKKQIVIRCIYNILTRLSILINNCNKNKLLKISDYIKNIDRNLVIEIPIYLSNPSYNLSSSIKTNVDSLNEYERNYLMSICLNFFAFNLDSVKLNIDKINNNINFKNNPEKYKDIIKQLLCVYIPIYSFLGNKKVNITQQENYHKTYYLNQLLDKKILSRNLSQVFSDKLMINYITYKAILASEYIDEENRHFYAIKSILNNDYDISQEDVNSLLELAKFSIEYSTIEEDIEKIKYLYNLNINSIKLFCLLDLIKYNDIKKKKKAFGLK